MKLKGAFIYLGLDVFHSNKDNKDYKSACFLQGTDVQKVFVNEEQLKIVNDIPVNTPVEAEFDIRLGQKSFISIISVAPVIYAVPALSVESTSTENVPSGSNTETAATDKATLSKQGKIA